MSLFDRIILSARGQGCDWSAALERPLCPSCRMRVGSLHMTQPGDGPLRIRCLTCILRLEAGLPALAPAETVSHAARLKFPRGPAVPEEVP